MLPRASLMKLPSLIGVASLSVLCLNPARANPTAPVDLAQRNAPFSPAATIAPEKQTPARDDAVQDKRVEKTVIEKTPAAVGDRRAAIDVQETRGKNVREKKSSRPAATEQAVSAFNHREAPFATATDATKPPLVAKYQDGLTAATAVKPTQFSALDRATAAKINRFVFRKNSPDPAPITGGAPVTSAGGAPLRN